MSDLAANAREVLRGWAPPSEAQAALRRDYLALLDVRPDAVWRDALPDHLTTSVLVLSHDRRRALLTLHAKAEQWFQLGGHCEAGDASLAAAALREGIEESGIAGLDVDPEPVHLDVHPVPFCGGPTTRHFDVRFLAVAPAGAEASVSEESLDLRWFDVEHLPTSEPGVLELRDLALARVSPARA